MDNIHSQQLFFNHIKSKLAPHLSLVDEVAELLNISNDSAYRRIRGEKPIGLDEIQLLCNKYKVSLDQLLQIQTNTVIFSGNKIDLAGFTLNEYFQDMINQLTFFSTLDNPHFYYYNKDIPIFHFMQFPELNAFKLFFWKRTVLGYSELAREQFKGEEFDEGLSKKTKKSLSYIHRLPLPKYGMKKAYTLLSGRLNFTAS